ncbi:MAG: hypothetical protein P0Y64_16235 [Candidatus Sphingomonas colombiensis]|nr:hypothetical protein [Sphingomonas sp.]WEK42874.1 MAG: hypothetical protein P0Y64_16235 [Sphingomonas sp.]
MTGCGARGGDGNALAAVEQEHRELASGKGDLDCAIGDARAFSRSCALEREQSERGLVLTVRHADGGFRRLLVTKDGRGVVAADGAAPAEVVIMGANEIEVTLAGDRYRLPATIGARR